MSEEKKKLPEAITKEFWLNIDYAIAKWMTEKEPVAVSEQQTPIETPNYRITFMTIKVSKEPNKPKPQLWLHLRINDKRTGEDLDIEGYAQTREIRKFHALAEDMQIRNIPFKSITETITEPEQEKIRNITTRTETTRATEETTVEIRYYYEGNHIRTAKLRLEQNRT